MYKDGINLVTKDTDLQLTQKQAKACVGFSRMTVRNETGEYDNFIKIQFVELLEMVGRIAQIKYLHTENEMLPLQDRCFFVLEIMLLLVGRSVIPVINNEETESESDDDY